MLANMPYNAPKMYQLRYCNCNICDDSYILKISQASPRGNVSRGSGSSFSVSYMGWGVSSGTINFVWRGTYVFWSYTALIRCLRSQ